MNSVPFPARLTVRQIGIALFIIAIAFTLRVVVVWQRAGGDPAFIPPPGTDPATYLNQARGVLAGTFPTVPFYHHPGPTYVFAGLITLLGDSVPLLMLVIALLDTLTTGLLIAAGWLLTRRVWGGWLAGGLYALYPLAIFYATTGTSEPQAVFVLTLLLTLAFWQRERVVWWRTLLMGVSGGALLLLRLNLAPIVLLAGIWLLAATHNRRHGITHSAVYVLLAVLMIAPATLHNYRSSGGQFIPVATTGILEIYLANNRDSNAQNARNIATETLETDYISGLLRDIRVAPEHFIGLLVYKFATFWDAADIGNNVSFVHGLEASPVLRFLPLSFPLLALLGLPALVMLWKQDRAAALFLGLIVATLLLSFLLVFVFGRLRHPAAPVLILLAASGMVNLPGLSRRTVVRPAVALGFTIMLLLFSAWMLNPAPRFPAKRTYTTLPAGAHHLDAAFGDVILRGWRAVPGWNAAAVEWAQTGDAYAVELFWQIQQPVSTEYQFNLRYQQEETVSAEASRPLGAVSFPHLLTSAWDTAVIYGEIVSLRFDEAVTDYQGGQIRIGVWHWDQQGQIVNVPFSADSMDIALQPFALYAPADTADLPEDALLFGEEIALTGIDYPATIQPGTALTLRFSWQAVTEVTRVYHLFLHLEDENGTLAAQGDGLPVPGLFTQNWMPGRILSGEHTLMMPDVPGTYHLYGGLYDASGRLAVNAPDNRPLLLTIQVE